MMAGVYGDFWRRARGQRTGRAQNSRELRLGIDRNLMRLGDGASSLVIHAGRQVLIERAGAPDVERLHAVTDPKDRLAHVIGVLQEKLIGIVTQNVSIGGRRVARGSIFFGI